jgi:hypothetical protein
LETRDAKHEPHTLTELRASWHNQAAEILGGPHAVERMVRTALHPGTVAAPRPDDAWIDEAAGRVLAVMEHTRHLAAVACPGRGGAAGLAAEQRLVAAASRRDGRVVPAAAVEVALLELTANGVDLNAGQIALVRQLASSGARGAAGDRPSRRREDHGDAGTDRPLDRGWRTSGWIGPIGGRRRPTPQPVRR